MVSSGQATKPNRTLLSSFIKKCGSLLSCCKIKWAHLNTESMPDTGEVPNGWEPPSPKLCSLRLECVCVCGGALSVVYRPRNYSGDMLQEAFQFCRGVSLLLICKWEMAQKQNVAFGSILEEASWQIMVFHGDIPYHYSFLSFLFWAHKQGRLLVQEGFPEEGSSGLASPFYPVWSGHILKSLHLECVVTPVWALCSRP